MQDYQDSEAVVGDGNLEPSELDISDKTMAASGVLKTITTVLLSLESTPDLLSRLENALLPVLTYTLENTITGEISNYKLHNNYLILKDFRKIITNY